MEGFVLHEPCVICPCGKTYIEMSDEQREAYYAALERLKENRRARKAQDEVEKDTREWEQKSDEVRNGDMATDAYTACQRAGHFGQLSGVSG